MKLASVQPEFVAALEEAVELCRANFGTRLQALYIGGSIAFGEALARVSDGDFFIFVEPEVTDSDRAWCRAQEANLSSQHPAYSLFHLSIYSLEVLRRDVLWRVIYRYNAIRLYGDDLIARLEREGIATPPPSRALARSRVGFLEKITDKILKGDFAGFEKVAFKLPPQPSLCTRKLVRWFVVLEGAYLLIHDGHFHSFRQADVLVRLQAHYPEWTQLLQTCEGVLARPLECTLTPQDFLAMAEPFLRWSLARQKA